MCRTTLVNLFGGPGCGKSTMAAGIVHNLKKWGHEAVLIHEEYKAAALTGNRPDAADELEIVARQIRNERRFYNLAEFIVTDSPLELNAFYSDRRYGSWYGGPYMQLVKEIRGDGPSICFHNFLVIRQIDFDQKGRYESEHMARVLDNDLEDYLTNYWNYIFEKITLCPDLAAEHILKLAAEREVAEKSTT